MFKFLALAFALSAQLAFAESRAPVAEFSFNDRLDQSVTPVSHINYKVELFEDGRMIVTTTTVCPVCMIDNPLRVFETTLNPKTMSEVLEYATSNLGTARIVTVQNMKMCRMMRPAVEFDLGLKIKRKNGGLKLVLGNTACYEPRLTRPADEYAFEQAKDLKKILQVLAYEASK